MSLSIHLSANKWSLWRNENPPTGGPSCLVAAPALLSGMTTESSKLPSSFFIVQSCCPLFTSLPLSTPPVPIATTGVRCLGVKVTGSVMCASSKSLFLDIPKRGKGKVGKEREISEDGPRIVLQLAGDLIILHQDTPALASVTQSGRRIWSFCL